ncbi:MAG TPA: patatin-like phospholipase family protein [Actinomycetota bacterium]|nr:patatin-like phospholipase family protein [Actinomycetota bacterium]
MDPEGVSPRAAAPEPGPARGLVLGGGGLVGMGYHAGALQALEEWGVDLGGSDVVVGTSAGAVIAAYVAAGWTGGDFYDYAHGRHPESEHDEADQRQQVRTIFTPLWHSRAERVRRGIGSTFAVVSSRGYWRRVTGGRVPVGALRKVFPAGLYSTEETRFRLHADLPEEWPREGVYICAADLYTGERVAFGAPDAPPATFPEAVRASTSIPGVFPPVRIGDRHYVDGGVVSATSLDLAVDAGCKTILCVAPLGYRKDDAVRPPDPRLWSSMLVRSLFARTLRREVLAARAAGVEVLVVRPWLNDLRAHGTNSMRYFDRAALASSAREGTLRLLEAHADHPALAAAMSRRAAGRAGG